MGPLELMRRKAYLSIFNQGENMFGFGLPELIILLVIFLIFVPFIVNARLARSRGKSIGLILLLTFFFSWLVTLFLAFMPKVESTSA